MSAILLNNDAYDGNVKDDGIRNLLTVLDIFEQTIYTLEYPQQSVMCNKFFSDRYDGITVSESTLPHIIKKHFVMTPESFFTELLTEEFCLHLQLEMLESCASLCLSQTKTMYYHLLYLQTTNE